MNKKKAHLEKSYLMPIRWGIVGIWKMQIIIQFLLIG